LPEDRTRIRVRTYRQGLGDCHLVTIMRNGEPVCRILIDCGVYQTTSGGADFIRRSVRDVIDETGGHVDVLAVTHEHWDHVSGFNQARDQFALPGEPAAADKLSVGEVWMGWTEDPADPVAQRIGRERGVAIRRVAAAAEAATRFGAASLANGLEGVLGFFGGARRTTADALETVRSLATAPRYCRPSDPPRRLVDGVMSYVLGPPLDPAALYRLSDDNETYSIESSRPAQALFDAVDGINGTGARDDARPFHRRQEIPAPFLEAETTPITQEEPDFFERSYWGEHAEFGDQQWRRIDHDWLGASREFALKLDNATNNTSLVIALEMEKSERTLLFVADAQVGSWLSWGGLTWDLGARTVTGADLMARAAFLKVGHHGSHNATLRGQGLERMKDLIAFIPTDETLAKKVGWGRMPLPNLVGALERQADGRVVRTDQDFSADEGASPELRAFAERLTMTDLYYEIEIG
jgi:hypothetical protein